MPQPTKSHLVSSTLVPIRDKNAQSHLDHAISVLESMGFQKKERGFVASWDKTRWFQFRHRGELEIVVEKGTKAESKPWNLILPREGMVGRMCRSRYLATPTRLPVQSLELEWIEGGYRYTVTVRYIEWLRTKYPPSSLPHTLPGLDGTSMVVQW